MSIKNDNLSISGILKLFLQLIFFNFNDISEIV